MGRRKPRAENQDRAQEWLGIVEPHFGFVRAHGFTRVELQPEVSFWETWVQYRSPVSAVRVKNSTESQSVEVELLRLVDGEVPSFPLWVTSDRIDVIPMIILLGATRPDLAQGIRQRAGLHGRAAQELNAQLSFWAQALREVGGDFLAGGFDTFEHAAAYWRTLNRHHPQGVTIYLPVDSDTDAETAAAEAEHDLPPGVDVTVHRYARHRRSRWWERRYEA